MNTFRELVSVCITICCQLLLTTITTTTLTVWDWKLNTTRQLIGVFLWIMIASIAWLGWFSMILTRIWLAKIFFTSCVLTLGLFALILLAHDLATLDLSR